MGQRSGMANRARWVALLVVALIVRALVPSGWMPVATAQGVRLTLCAGQDISVPAMAWMHHVREQGGHEGGKHSLPDHPCAFAGLGLAADTALPPVVLPVGPTPTPVFTPHGRTLLVGQGLAAPPPPATGPPAFA